LADVKQTYVSYVGKSITQRETLTFLILVLKVPLKVF